ncbi:UDP-N-acetylmuramate dehydrogenase [Candidatus Margulisiibacteriota bacterium]
MKYLRDEPLKNHTSFRIGGPADYFCVPKSKAELKEALAFAKLNKLGLFVLGAGSNVLISDEGFRGLVVKLADGPSAVEVKDQTVVAGAGVLLSKLLKILAQKELSGLEFLAGVPGSLGGAVVMNLGAWEESIGQYVLRVTCVERDGLERTLTHAELDFGYRHSILQRGNLFVVGIELKLKPGSKPEIEAQINKNIKARQGNQPLEFPSAGSVFKNPPNEYAWKLIDAAGCKGLKVGQAQLSAKHTNFIVNLGAATAQDVQELICQIQAKVKDRFDIMLEPEIKIMVN